MNTLVRRLLTTTALVGVVVITSISISAQYEGLAPAQGRGQGAGPGQAQDQGQGRGGREGAAPRPAAGPVPRTADGNDRVAVFDGRDRLAPRTADGKPDLRGIWSGASVGGMTHSNIIELHEGGFGINAGRSLIIDPPDGVIPYKPEALVERNRRRDDINAYEDRASHCEPYGMARLHQFTLDVQYVGNLIIMESSTPTRQARFIDMSKTKHLPDSFRLWMGDSIAKWEGDTLVIETTNFNGKTGMSFSDYHGPNAVIVERYTMTDSNTIRWRMTITDPEVFTRPWTIESTAPLARRPATTVRDEEDDCNEGNIQLRHLKNTYEKEYGTPVPRSNSLQR